jgi:uncharacterized phage-associated protein
MKTLLEFDHKKATQAINFFARKEGLKIDKLKLIKLVYLADRFHLRRYGRPITNDAYIAMPLGPVGSSVKDIAEFSDFLDETERKYASSYLAQGGIENTVVSVADVDNNVFSKSELEALNFVYKEFGNKSTSFLVDVVHKYPDWEKFKKSLETKETTREPMSYSDFFKNPSNGKNDKLAFSPDILNASQELFEEEYEIAEYWK